MAWRPDEQLELHIQRIITRAFEDGVRREREEEERTVAKLSAQGLLHSGARLHASEELAQNTLLAFSSRVVTEVFGAFKDNYGSVPAEATSWIREVLGQRFEGYAKGRGASLAQQRTQMHVPTT